VVACVLSKALPAELYGAMNTGIYDDAMPKRCGSEKPTPCGGCALRAEEGDQVTQIMCVRKEQL